MNKITLDLSRYGVSQGVTAFIVSLLKTGLAAGLVAVGAKLATYSITGSANHIEILTALVVIARALISGGVTWLKVQAPVDAAPVDPSVG